jgi:hypothetical protein
MLGNVCGWNIKLQKQASFIKWVKLQKLLLIPHHTMPLPCRVKILLIDTLILGKVSVFLTVTNETCDITLKN